MLQNTRIILVQTRNPLNIGAAARGMANFGFSDLGLVEPYTPAWQEARSAVGAEELLKKARVYPSVAAAVSDCHFVIGTTTGQRRQLNLETLDLPELPQTIAQQASSIKKHKTALLFGSEKTGLLNEHFAFCHAALTIPTDVKTPSMNLSHAITVCCYELAKMRHARRFTREKPVRQLPRMSELERVTERLLRLYQLSDFQKGAATAVKRAWIRRILLELNLDRNRLLQAGTLTERIVEKLEEKQR
ncbi:MAG TPA: RNA methyltransferase [Elusimicrobiales bacterium]|nr:RNA methyltransferase [Elusimicrobiales bacterium]